MSEYRKDALAASEDEEIIGLYDKELHLEMLRNTELYEAEQKGMEQGIEQGIEEEKLSMVKAMLKEKLDISLISKITGLSIEEINQLI